MPLPLTLIPTAISAIASLVRFRDRVDDILALNRATEGLPFALPPAPPNVMAHKDALLEFYDTDAGKMLIELRNLQADLAKVRSHFGSEANFGPRQRLFDLYCQAAEIRHTKAGPPGADIALGAQGPSSGMRLAWFVVESHRLARNPAVTRVLLAAADTLLEFGAQNASLLVKEGPLREALETLLTEFAFKRDWDDVSGEQIFKTLLGSTAAALAQHGAELSNSPALGAFFGALSDVQETMGAEFVQNFISRSGFTELTGFFLTRAADTPGVLPGGDVIRGITGVILREAGESFADILDDPSALLGVLESGLAAAATYADAMINRKLGSRPLLGAVLSAVSAEVRQQAAAHKLFAAVASGGFLAALYETTLAAVVARPDLLASSNGLGKFAASLVNSVAKSLIEAGLDKAFTTATLQRVGAAILEALAEEPEMLAGNSDFVGRVLEAVLPAVAEAARDGLALEDVIEITQTTLRTVGSNIGLVEMDDRLRSILAGAALALTDARMKQLLTDRGRKEVFLQALEAIVVNPAVWRGFAERDLVKPILTHILRGLATDPTRLLTGPAMAETARLLLFTVARRGRQLIDAKVEPDLLGDFIIAALEHAGAAIGEGIDGETLPEFLQRAIDAYLRTPFALSQKKQLNELLDQVLPVPETAFLLNKLHLRVVRPAPKPARSSQRGRTRS